MGKLFSKEEKVYQYHLENVWENKSAEIKEEIINFWLSEKVITEQSAKQRVNQVFIVCRDLEDKIIGVNTLYKQYNVQLNNYFYYYRTYISPKARKSQMVVDMMLVARDYLEARYVNKQETETIGLFLEVENKDLKERLNQAIWPGSKFIYIGENQRGDHLRVYYFKNALIS